MLQCRPAPATGSSGSQQQDSILVWVDKANDVMAFGSTREDGSLPAFASAMRSAEEAPDARQSFHVATRKHTIKISHKKIKLRLENFELACSPTWDD